MKLTINIRNMKGMLLVSVLLMVLSHVLIFYKNKDTVEASENKTFMEFELASFEIGEI
jgi:hypothetical protein